MVQRAMVYVIQSCQTQRATLDFWYWTEHAIHKVYFSKVAFWVGLVRGCTLTALTYQWLFCIKHLCFHYVYFLWYLDRLHSKETLKSSQTIFSKCVHMYIYFYTIYWSVLRKYANQLWRKHDWNNSLCWTWLKKLCHTGNQSSSWY